MRERPLRASARGPISALRAALPLAVLAAGARAGDEVALFTEEAQDRGIVYTVSTGSPAVQFGCGLAFCDLDGDGDPDLVTLGAGDGLVGVFENDGTGNFTDRSATSAIFAGAEASGVAAADYDADGDVDVFVSRYAAPDVLARNEGAFVFTDVSAAAFVDDDGNGVGAAWGDYDGDGWLDLYVANRSVLDFVENPNRLYRNEGDGTFTEVAATVGVDDGVSPSFQPVFFDMELDGDADLYLATDKGYVDPHQNHLWENVGGAYSEITESSGTAADIDAMGIAVADWDGNELPDLYVTNTPAGNLLYLQLSPGSFTELATFAGVASNAIGWGTLFLDYDNDGRRDLYVCNSNDRNRLYDYDGTWPATDVGPAVGVADFGLSYGCAKADVDGDGDVDIAVSNFLTNVRLYVNPGADGRHWTKLRVAGRGPNRDGIGAVVRVRTGGTWQVGEVHAGSSYKCQNELVLHYGLDGATQLDEVEVRWPGGVSRLITGLQADRTWTLLPPERLGDADGDGDVDAVDLEAFVACFTGEAPGALEPGCEALDLDGDADVDRADLALFLRRFTPTEEASGEQLQ